MLPCRRNVFVMVTHIFFYYWWGGTKSVGTAATFGLLYKPQMIDEDDCLSEDGKARRRVKSWK
jgi:hypothetical protein